MRTRENILYDGSNVIGYASNKLLLEVLLDLRDQNTEIIRNLEYLCKKIIM